MYTMTLTNKKVCNNPIHQEIALIRILWPFYLLSIFSFDLLIILIL